MEQLATVQVNRAELHFLRHHITYLSEVLGIMDKRGEFSSSLAQIAKEHLAQAQLCLSELKEA